MSEQETNPYKPGSVRHELWEKAREAEQLSLLYTDRSHYFLKKFGDLAKRAYERAQRLKEKLKDTKEDR